MEESYLVSDEARKDFAVALAAVFEAIPKGKRGMLFRQMSNLECIGKAALEALRQRVSQTSPTTQE